MRVRVEFEEQNRVIDALFGEQTEQIEVLFDEQHESMDVLFDISIVIEQYLQGDPYEGDYAVTPKVAAQTLPTEKKLMMDDLTVNAIPYYNVSNPSGGQTIYIGNEV